MLFLLLDADHDGRLGATAMFEPEVRVLPTYSSGSKYNVYCILNTVFTGFATLVGSFGVLNRGCIVATKIQFCNNWCVCE